MSPLDEIRHINKLKKQGKQLSPYQQWVLGGCKGPHPSRRPKYDAKGRQQKSMFCPGTKLTTEHYTQVLDLINENAALRRKLAAVRKLIKRADRLVRALDFEFDALVDTADERNT